MEKCIYCGSEIKISKKGNKYCSNICWTKEPYKSQIKKEQIEYEAYMDSVHGDWGDR